MTHVNASTSSVKNLWRATAGGKKKRKSCESESEESEESESEDERPRKRPHPSESEDERPPKRVHSSEDSESEDEMPPMRMDRTESELPSLTFTKPQLEYMLYQLLVGLGDAYGDDVRHKAFVLTKGAYQASCLRTWLEEKVAHEDFAKREATTRASVHAAIEIATRILHV